MKFAGQRIVIFGDSHVAGWPGEELQRQLRARGAREVHTIGREGWGVVRWRHAGEEYGSPTLGYGSPVLANLDAVRPTLVLFWFGVNDTPGDVFRQALQSVKNMAQTVTPEIWFIGAPSYARSDLQERGSRLNVISRSVFGSRFIDSQRLTTADRQGRQPDGVHYTRAGAEVWVRRVLDAIERRAVHGPSWFAVAAVAAMGVFFYTVK